MPPFFNKHKDTSPPEPPHEAAPDAVDLPIPLVASPDALNTNGDSPHPIINAPEPENTDDLDTAKRLDGAFKVTEDAQSGYSKYQGSTAVKLVNRSGDILRAIKTDVTTARSFSSPLKPVYESEAMKVVRTGANALVNSLPGLVKALDEVAKLHPFIGIAVGAFRIVVELDLKRRDNDKKIAALFLQMKDMMEALLQLRSIKDHESVGPGGQTIKARMQNLVKQTADDITACGNACDAYSKKRLVVKVIKGTLWDSTLKGYIDVFAKHRKEFTFALSIHTGIGVDDANRKLDSLDSKMDVLVEFFTMSVTPEFKELAALVQKKGGARAVMDSNETLNELLDFKGAATTSKRAEHDGPEHNSYLGQGDLDALKLELFESPELAIKKNFDVFERKFKMQQRELSEEMRRVVHHEGDRVIEAVTSGSHDRIIDPEIHEIWKEMRWPGHVKARHFVLALRDYYRQQIEVKKRAKGAENPSHIGDDDEWALEWISINRLQSIAEAFDDDASGFITVAEVNQFTTARPKDWSLSHWLAYWAIGWQMTATYYRNKVVDLLGKMFAIQSLIHPANAQAVEKYLATVYRSVCTLTSSFVCANESDALKAHFQSYVDDEEKRLREGLETVRYDIDAIDTLTLVTGPGRIEKYLFPLLYLLLKRDYEIFRACRKMVVHKDELWDSADTLVWVFDAVDFRHNDLEVLFKQQNLDPAQQFKAHANELLEYWHNGDKFWSLENLRKWKFTEYEYVDAEEDQEVDISKLLNYPSAADSLYNDVEEMTVTENDTRADDDVRMILGRWTGLIGAKRWPATAMVTFCFHASADSASYEASDTAAEGTAFTILGGYTKKEDGSIGYNFSRTYAARHRKTYFTGSLTEDGGTLAGSWGYDDDEKPYHFLFKRVPAETLIARPPPTEFEENKIRALWKYALTAVHNEVRRKMFSWSYLKERRDIRHEYLHLVEREIDNVSTDDDLDRLALLNSTATCEEVRSFYVLKDYGQRSIPSHLANCDACGEHIYGARLMCLKCGTPSTLDFCDKPDCRAAVMTRNDLTEPHLPTHDFVKVRRPFHQQREIGKILRLSDAGLERARKLLSKAARAQAAEAKTTELGWEGAVTSGESDSESAAEPEKKLSCISCSATVSYSCWYCIDCPAESNVFVCQECDEKGGVEVGDHKATHGLVHCKKKVITDSEGDAARNSEQRFTAVEGKLAALSAQMERIEKLLETLVGARSA